MGEIPAVHPFNRPPTLRDVLEARNLVLRAVTDASFHVVGALVTLFLWVILMVIDVKRTVPEWAWILAALVTLIVIPILFRPRYSKGLLASEQALQAVPEDDDE